MNVYDNGQQRFIISDWARLTGFLPPFRLGGEGIASIVESTENSELARMLEVIEEKSIAIASKFQLCVRSIFDEMN